VSSGDPAIVARAALAAVCDLASLPPADLRKPDVLLAVLRCRRCLESVEAEIGRLSPLLYRRHPPTSNQESPAS
jgi:hypothetical protein